MTRKNLLDEIVNKRARTDTSSTRMDEFAKRMSRLDIAKNRLLELSEPDSVTCDEELTRHFPVALVACIEGFYRKAVADLIDHGSPFIDRVAKLRNVDITLEAAAAIQTKKITLGEYVSHFISFGSLEDINRCLSSMLAFDFLDRLITSEFHLYEDEPPIQIEELRKDFVVAVRDLFRARHMLCHEFASELVIDNAAVIQAFAATDVLVSLSEFVIASELQGPPSSADEQVA